MSKLKFNHEEESESLMPQALAIVEDSESDQDSDNPPMDGFAYLKSVIKERKRIADTVTADIDPSKIKAPTCLDSFSGGDRVKATVPDHFIPSSKWQNEQVSEFSDTRLKLNRHLALVKKKGEFKPLKLPSKESEMLWCLFCHGNEVWSDVKKKRKNNSQQNSSEIGQENPSNSEDDVTKEMMGEILESSKQGTPPSLSVILSMPVNLVEQILEYQVSWIQSTGWREDYGAWLYSLLSRIEKPLTPDMGSILRDLALFCSQERSRLAQLCPDFTPQPSPDDQAQESPADFQYHNEIAAFNLFICLVAKYFNQGDLADT